MKYIYLIPVFIMGLSKLNAQEVILNKENPIKEIVKGTHYKTEKKILEKFEGVWVFRKGDEIFKIQISTDKFYNKLLDVYTDMLIGSCCYNQVEKDCHLNIEEQQLSCESTNQDLEQGFSYFMFLDTKDHKLGKAKLEILENGTARWTLKNRGGVIINDNKADGTKWKEGFSVPTNVILTKVK